MLSSIKRAPLRVLTPVLAVCLALLPAAGFAQNVEHGWNSPALVAKQVINKFAAVNTYRAKFNIETKVGNRKKEMTGTCYYKKDGKMRFDFSKPGGDKIISDGKMLWIYVKRLNAVGQQSLTLNKKRDNKPVFTGVAGPGIKRLFSKYHYRFDDVKQPRVIDGKKFFVLQLNQKVKIGGFPNIKLYIDPQTYFIRKAIATNDFGLTSTIQFNNIRTNIEVEDGKFRYTIPKDVKTVQNPLVGE